MIASHIHDALDQVRQLQETILQKKLFRGYSGRARLLSGLAALLGAATLSFCSLIPATPFAHLMGWSIVLGVSVLFNYLALMYWFLFDAEVRRNPLMLKPAIDALPALGVGGVLTFPLLVTGQYNLLPGMWMCLYGLAQVSYRQSLPPAIYRVGLAYIASGALLLLLSTGLLFVPGISMESLVFTNPWPMGVIFFAGEWTGGAIMLENDYKRSQEQTDEQI
jgi:hypothetical protein